MSYSDYRYHITHICLCYVANFTRSPPKTESNIQFTNVGLVIVSICDNILFVDFGQRQIQITPREQCQVVVPMILAMNINFISYFIFVAIPSTSDLFVSFF